MQQTKYLLRLRLSWSLILLFQSTLWASSPMPPPEADLDKLMTDYIKGIRAAFEEKDDKKSAALVRKLKTDLMPRYNKLMPELMAWKKSMSEADLKAFKKRAESKPWVKEMITMGFNPANQQRLEKSPEFKRAMDDLSVAFKDLTEQDEGEEEEGTDQEDNR